MKYSVIVPVYQCMRDLAACVSSVVDQTERDWELILVDDGSTDGSGALCDRLAAENEQIRVFHQANKGASGARNTGLDHARGDYILFLDGDDTIEADLLEQSSAVLSAEDVKLVIYGMSFDFFDQAEKLTRSEPKSVKHRDTVKLQSLLEAFPDYFFDNAVSSACNKVFSAALLKENHIRFTEQMILYEDLDFVLKVLPFCGRIAFLDQAYYHYRIREKQDHVAQRVNDLNMLHGNLLQLADSTLALHSESAARVIANLCAQLYDRYLLLIPQSKEEAEEAGKSILSSPALAQLGKEGISPEENSSPTWMLLAGGRSSALWRSITKRRFIRRMKQSAKRMLKLFGMDR